MRRSHDVIEQLPGLSSAEGCGGPWSYDEFLETILSPDQQEHEEMLARVGGAFASSANVGGGNETTVMDLLKALLIHGMIVSGSAEGDHYGPVAIGKPDNRAQNECKKLGRLVATLAVKLHG